MSGEWRQYKLREVVLRAFSGPSPDCEEIPVTGGQAWAVLKTTAITWDGWNQYANKVLPRNFPVNTDLKVSQGDILITKAGPRERTGVVAHVSTVSVNAIPSGKMICFRLDPKKAAPGFVYRAMALPEARQFLSDRTTGMAESQVNFSNEVALDLELTLPPLPEQRRIAAILDTLDRTIEGTQRVIEKLQATRQGLLHDQINSLTISRGDYRSLEQLVRADSPIRYGIVQPGPYDSDGVAILNIGNIRNSNYLDTHKSSRQVEKRYVRSRVYTGDLLISIKGTIGVFGVVPGNFLGNITRDLARIRCDASIIDPNYLQVYFESQTGKTLLESAVVGTTRQEISIHVLRRLKVPVPLPQTQKDVVNAIGALDQEITTHVLKLNKLRALKRGLMEDLLTGRVRVVLNEKSG